MSSELAGYSDLPYLQQVMGIEWATTKLDGTPMRHEAAYAVTSLGKQEASAQRLLDLNREHGAIENELHNVRDGTFDEDRLQVRRGAAARSMASLRNRAISILRIAGAGVDGIAAAVRPYVYEARTSLRLIGLERGGSNRRDPPPRAVRLHDCGVNLPGRPLRALAHGRWSRHPAHPAHLALQTDLLDPGPTKSAAGLGRGSGAQPSAVPHDGLALGGRARGLGPGSRRSRAAWPQHLRSSCNVAMEPPR